jgi:dihydropteroate synthase
MKKPPVFTDGHFMERVAGIKPASSPWKGDIKIIILYPRGNHIFFIPNSSLPVNTKNTLCFPYTLIFPMYLHVRGNIVDLTKTKIMGVVNVTPDSFSGDGILDPNMAIMYANTLLQDGADILDIGAESSRPGATPLSVEDELIRLTPVVEAMVKMGTIISIDTYKPEVADRMLGIGAHLINDIHGGRSDMLLQAVAKHRAGYIIMHMKGDPVTMQDKPQYGDIVQDLIAFFEGRIARAKKNGISEAQIMLDPGIGFGKTAEHNLEIIRRLPELIAALPYPFMLGTSRKRFIGAITGVEKASERIWGTAATVAIGVCNGATAIRVHDVKEMIQVAKMAEALRFPRSSSGCMP